MMPRNARKKKLFRHSTTFYRKLKTALENFSEVSVTSDKNKNNNLSINNVLPHVEQDESMFENRVEYNDPESEDESNWTDNTENEGESLTKIMVLRERLREWALKHKINHSALNNLFSILREEIDMNLPLDSRTLLETPKNILIENMGNGKFWYNGIENSLLHVLSAITETITISLIFNIDGLPPFKSSTAELWPILCKIEEMEDLQPIAIAIYCGSTKPPLKDFLSRFVDELNKLLISGIKCGESLINIKVKYFVCDTLARSFIKGVVIAYYGCIKCDCKGEYDKKGRHTSFPKIDCIPRTDQSFRNKYNEDHHKQDSPLLKLPIDMVEDVIVADSLHLIDLGVVRKCSNGWVHGSYNFKTKFSAYNIRMLYERLENCNTLKPAEIHRAIRTVTSLKYWKSSEFHIFICYVGMVVLKGLLPDEVYHHFLILVCAVTIVSCGTHLQYIQVADHLFKDYIEHYKRIYGLDSISSNVHNLCHIVPDVKRFGSLLKISAYPFENFLGYLKSLLRNGNRPLSQVAKRITELFKFNMPNNLINYPVLKKENTCRKHELNSCTKVFYKLEINKNFVLTNDMKNKWFLTKNNEIVSMINATFKNDIIYVYGAAIKNKGNFFEQPIKSSYLNIFKSNGETVKPKLFALKEIKCKMFLLKNEDFIFVPLLHTL